MGSGARIGRSIPSWRLDVGHISLNRTLGVPGSSGLLVRGPALDGDGLLRLLDKLVSGVSVDARDDLDDGVVVDDGEPESAGVGIVMVGRMGCE
jgi:hypothetical protein